MSFDLAPLTGGSDGEFGVALRSPNSSLSAALTLYFNASGPDADGTRMVHVRTTQHLRPSVPAAPLPLLPVLKGERLTVRALIDRAPHAPDLIASFTVDSTAALNPDDYGCSQGRTSRCF